MFTAQYLFVKFLKTSPCKYRRLVKVCYIFCSKNTNSQETLIYHIVRSTCFVEFAWFLAKFCNADNCQLQCKTLPFSCKQQPLKYGSSGWFDIWRKFCILEFRSNLLLIKCQGCNINMQRIANAVPRHPLFWVNDIAWELTQELICNPLCNWCQMDGRTGQGTMSSTGMYFFG